MAGSFDLETKDSALPGDSDHLKSNRFIARTALFVVGSLAATSGMLLSRSHLVIVLVIPGYALLFVWFGMECRTGRLPTTTPKLYPKKWQGGHGGGSFFFGLGAVVGIMAAGRVFTSCPGSDTPDSVRGYQKSS